jgi:hypothetical protein
MWCLLLVAGKAVCGGGGQGLGIPASEHHQPGLNTEVGGKLVLSSHPMLLRELLQSIFMSDMLIGGVPSMRQKDASIWLRALDSEGAR